MFRKLVLAIGAAAVVGAAALAPTDASAHWHGDWATGTVSVGAFMRRPTSLARIATSSSAPSNGGMAVCTFAATGFATKRTAP